MKDAESRRPAHGRGRWIVAAIVLTAALPTAGRLGEDRDYRSRLELLQNEIERLASESDRLAREERGLLGRLERLAADARLIDAKLEQLQLELRRVESDLDEVNREIADVTGRLNAQRQTFRSTVLVLQRLGPLGRLRLLMEASDGEQLAASLRLAAEQTGRQRAQVTAIRDELAKLESLRRERDAAASQLERLSDRTREARAELRRSINERRALLEQVRIEQRSRERAMSELEDASTELSAIVSGARPGEDWESKLDVRNFRGLLPMPAIGPLAEPYGNRRDPRFGTVLPHPGWDIDAEFGARVQSVFDGRVAWSGWLRGYGLVIVIDHGQGVHSVYAHLSVILAEANRKVLQGETIGRVGDTGSLRGPFLYFEMRVDGKTVDPARWIDRAKQF